MNKAYVISLLKDQNESIVHKRILKLTGLSIKPYDLFEYINEYLQSFEPQLIIEKLSLPSNNLNEIPSNFTKISKNLKYLDLHNNQISFLSHDFINNLPNLEALDLSSNKLSYLPSNISSLHHLKVLSIKDNEFEYITPELGELKSLNLIELSNNPLILPSIELISNLQSQASNIEWVSELKHYLISNQTILHQKIVELKEDNQFQTLDQWQSSANNSMHITPPSMRRSHSISEPGKSKISTKASKRMGLIIKKTDENGSSTEDLNSSTIHSFSRSFNQEDLPHSASAVETTFQISSPPPQPLHTNLTAPNSASNSPSTTLNKPTLRSRSNTMKEIDQILEKNDNVDTEHKSSAYFKRLSVLQEQPSDEVESNVSISRPTTRQTLDPNFKQTQQATSSAIASSTHPSSSSNIPISTDGSPNRVSQPTKKHTNAVIIKVSRKVLFSFSELHSSIRRFTAFCTDKKVTMKMVSYLYGTKSNIDNLVENLEIVEENGGNTEQIAQSLQTCMMSFKSIMNLLHQNINKFVSKIDVCFIRMLYLSIFGSISELQNAYNLLTVKTSPVKSSTNELKQKLSINTNVGSSFNEVDEKLYATIEAAISNAQSIFTDLNKNVNRGATAHSASVSPSVTAKIKDLSNNCGSSLDIIKRLSTRLITIRNNPSQTTKKLFAEDINQFLKSIVQILAAVKGIVVDIPILDDVRASMSSITKTAKEVTYMLEISSYKSLLAESSSSSTSNQPPNFTPLSAHAPALPSTATFNNGPVPIRNPMMPTTNASTTNIQEQETTLQSNGPLTAPPQSSGQIFAKNGMNPFDKLIMTKSDEL
ncbi:SOG2 [Candida pseudojiufengensis]|uniref:SOG2 n=1 Tax=Candida pseudojiufengensis TaxID=497109 RepID=UPI002224E635|nr:SOG2 [Candida pseudojiufengensis]KAI5964571.1 SOG2 [Candida pseudojiufengensis]